MTSFISNITQATIMDIELTVVVPGYMMKMPIRENISYQAVKLALKAVIFTTAACYNSLVTCQF